MDKLMVTLIEEKLTEKLQSATMDGVSTPVVKGIEYMLLDWPEIVDYPRIIIYCDNDLDDEEQVSNTTRANKKYVVNIMLLCYNETYAELIETRDIVLGRINTELNSDRRLDNLTDDVEKVWNSYIRRTRYSRSGINGVFHSLSWIEFIVETSII